MIVHALISGLVLCALALDLAAPPGTVAWLIYFVPLWAAGHWYGRSGGYQVTAVCTALLLLAGLRSLTGNPWSSELAPRLAGAAVLWGTAVSICVPA